MTSALVLAGHGSHISPNTAGIVWTLVDELRAQGVADEVTAAFWKEAPAFSRVLDTLTADDITITPLFTARGYFTQTVLPAEMELDGALTVRDGRSIRYTRTLGEHPRLAQIVRSRVEQVLVEFDLPHDDTAVALIGHGTKRSPESRDATEAQAAIMRDSRIVAETVAIYLDDDPDIPQLYHMTASPHVIAIPYFLASGSHTTLDVPAELGLQHGETAGQIRGRNVYYTPPVGEGDMLRDLALDLAREAGASLYAPRDGSTWDGYPGVGREELIDMVETVGNMQFGQLMLTPSTVSVMGDVPETTTLTTPSSLRTWVRDQPFRPLPTSRDLPGGWRIEIDVPHMLHGVVETVYPGAVADWAASRQGKLRTKQLADVAARQTGMFRELASLNQQAQSSFVIQICGKCVRHSTWFQGTSPADAIPCPEPCNYWMSKARKQQ